MRPQSQIYSRYFTYIKPVAKLPIIRTYGSTIFTLLVMTIFIFFAIKPTVETILVLQKKLNDAKLVLEKVEQKATNLSLGKQNYENLDSSVKSKIAGAIPDTAQLKSVIRTLEQTARNREASISALQVQPLVIDSPVDGQVGSLAELTFTFNVEGSYQNLLLLLQDLKVSDRLILLDNLSLSKSSEGTGLIMSLSGKAYYIK